MSKKINKDNPLNLKDEDQKQKYNDLQDLLTQIQAITIKGR